ncbi:hypothetical protein E2C01_080251 [Portunus trituberculatus]|uniref:Uncharacterized protein n=1 Tax=Portunus trituberculatus TaxID=210409 RepID=A0A5B7INT1_PORTR|nr:hypothetical protein [Portunus trituberculatus]
MIHRRKQFTSRDVQKLRLLYSVPASLPLSCPGRCCRRTRTNGCVLVDGLDERNLELMGSCMLDVNFGSEAEKCLRTRAIDKLKGAEQNETKARSFPQLFFPNRDPPSRASSSSLPYLHPTPSPTRVRPFVCLEKELTPPPRHPQRIRLPFLLRFLLSFHAV